MLKKVIFTSLIAIAIATNGCSKEERSEVEHSRIEETHQRENNSNNPATKTATAKITVTGITNGIEVIISEKSFNAPGNIYILKEATVTNGEAFINVSEYIGKKLYFRVQKNRAFMSEQESKTIVEGENSIHLVATEKDYTVKITVQNDNGKAITGKKVYATDATNWKSVSTVLSSYGDENGLSYYPPSLLSFTHTNAQGIAIFHNLRPVYNIQDYVFFIVTSTSPYYKKVAFTLDGTAKEHTFHISNSDSQTKKAPITFLIQDSNNKPIEGAQITIGSETKVTNILGSVHMEVPVNTTITYSIKTPCGNTKTNKYTTLPYPLGNVEIVKLTTAENCNNTQTDKKGVLTLKNTSSNPYTVSVGDRIFVMEGKSTKSIEVMRLVTYTVKWKQNSGYLFYPTEGSEEAEFNKNNTAITISFPNN